MVVHNAPKLLEFTFGILNCSNKPDRTTWSGFTKGNIQMNIILCQLKTFWMVLWKSDTTSRIQMVKSTLWWPKHPVTKLSKNIESSPSKLHPALPCDCLEWAITVLKSWSSCVTFTFTRSRTICRKRNRNQSMSQLCRHILSSSETTRLYGSLCGNRRISVPDVST